jgi:ribulose-5-phosphate 4-epimerase/fuculose-1-phosphate aldolase
LHALTGFLIRSAAKGPSITLFLAPEVFRSALAMAALQSRRPGPTCGAARVAGILNAIDQALSEKTNRFKRSNAMTPPVSSPAIKVVKSVREQVSPEEWQTRVDLAACYRLTAMYGMTEMIANHISCRVLGSHDHFLINPYGMLYEEIDASSLIKIDHDGNTIFNASDYGVNAAGFVIHSAIHMARRDVDCVAHTHTPAGMAVSAMECGLLPLAQTSMRFLHIAYHDFEGIADDVGERERLVADLGDHEAMILRNHGLLVVGRTIPATFNLLFRMERACEVQVMALSCNTKLIYPPQEILEATFDKVKPRPNLPNRNGELAWPALLRKLDRVDSSYRN